MNTSDLELLRETNTLARNTSVQLDRLAQDLRSHLQEDVGSKAAITSLGKRIGELSVSSEIGEAKIDAIAKRVGESVAASLDPMRVEQLVMKRRLARLRNFGAGIAAVVIAASAFYAETKGLEVAHKETAK